MRTSNHAEATAFPHRASHRAVHRIAHISDVHLLAPRQGQDLRVHFLSIGRVLDAAARIRKLSLALTTARRAGADHVVVSGDLTESGTPEQFETLAGVLDDLKLDPERLTLVPGNHDAYAAPDGWAKALRGPLAKYKDTAAEEPGKVLELGGLNVLPLDVAFHQPVTSSAGSVTENALERLERRLADRSLAKLPTLIVQHHPPYEHAMRAWQWIDGLRGGARLARLLERFSDVYVMHGHLHKVVDRALAGAKTRIFGAPALVEDSEDAPRVRMYEVRDGELTSMGLAA